MCGLVPEISYEKTVREKYNFASPRVISFTTGQPMRGDESLHNYLLLEVLENVLYDCLHVENDLFYTLKRCIKLDFYIASIELKASACHSM
ncbi:hypothetical protein J6590_050697 [Homalodisca vitripennis]|nr:hypothetical protein J6590_050697 [Homalodisca vitripennis]